MEKKIALIFLALSCCISIFSLFLSLERPVPETQSVLSDETESVSPKEPPIRYVLREYGGKLAVFQEENDIPYKEFNIPVALLSDYDQEILKKGIYAETEEEVRKLIEDYTS